MTFNTTCLFILLYFLRPFEIINSLRGLPILFAVGIIACLFLCFDILSGKVRLFKNGSDQMMVGFYVAIGLSHLSHSYIGGAIQSMQDFFPVFIGYFLVTHSIDSEKKLKFFLAVLIFSAAFLAYEGVLQSRTGVSYFGVQPIEQGAGYDDEGTRLTTTRIKWVGPFSDPNDLAMVFVLVIPLLIDYLLKRVVFIPLCLLGLIVYGLYLTNSRGGILALLAALLAYAILHYKSAKGLIIGLCLGGLLLTLGPSRMGNISASEDSAYGRLEAWYSGYQMFKSAPLMGVGKGMFTDNNELTAHNSFVLVFSELGFLGAFFFVGVFYFPMLRGYQTTFKNTDRIISLSLRRNYNAILSSLIGILTSMFFLSRSYVLLPFLLAALPMSISKIFTDKGLIEDGIDISDYKKIFMVTASSILLVNILIKFLL